MEKAKVGQQFMSLKEPLKTSPSSHAAFLFALLLLRAVVFHCPLSHSIRGTVSDKDQQLCLKALERQLLNYLKYTYNNNAPKIFVFFRLRNE